MRKLAALSLFLSAALCRAAILWVPFTAAGGEFRAMFPGRTVFQTGRSVMAGKFKIAYRTYVAQTAGTRCVVTACQIPKGMSSIEQDRFTQGLEEGFQINGRVQNVQKSVRVFGALGGPYISMYRQGQQIGIWVVTCKDRVYALSYSAPRAGYIMTEGTFFTSFRVNQIPVEKLKSK